MSFFEKNEIWVLIISVLIMTFVIGFREFTITSFISGFLMAAILIAIFVLIQKLAAYFLDCGIIFKLWTFRRYWFKWEDKLDWDFPIFVVFPLLFSVLSNGVLKWTALMGFDMKTTGKRIAHRFYELKEFDLALVGSSGILAVLVFALFLKIFAFNEFASIASWFALLNLVPLGNLNGTKIFFGSKGLWVFLAVFAIMIVILINLANVIATIFITLILAAAAAVVFYYLYYAKPEMKKFPTSIRG